MQPKLLLIKPLHQVCVNNDEVLTIYRFLVLSLRESVQIRSFFWSVFSCIRTKYGKILRISGNQAVKRYALRKKLLPKSLTNLLVTFSISLNLVVLTSVVLNEEIF